MANLSEIEGDMAATASWLGISSPPGIANHGLQRRPADDNFRPVTANDPPAVFAVLALALAAIALVVMKPV